MADRARRRRRERVQRRATNTIASHMSILNKLLDLPIHSVVEFGMGLNSTVLFANKLDDGLSIEMQNKHWYDKVCSSVNNWELMWLPGPTDAIDYVESLDQEFDMVFIDGHGDSRWQCANMAIIKQIPLIAIHDTDCPSYQWSKIEINGYFRHDYINKINNRGTTILSKRQMDLCFDDHDVTNFNW